ncbi:ATP synthase complex subunit H-domain-containing protein [Mycena albidolilacea]|uniref:ATP synthase complex subunit H-domain-containing protein n=1 Tax=Mycena albidolilacea TaxID=1033008 RepID=A0AAD7A9P6_9AGAR|nr:ATP synthase complex subunit H-domain-containing protein [Mycena albidolilacea]
MSSILRRAVGATRTVSCSRAFSSSAAARKDFVQELYLKEIKAYKAPPAAKDAHVGVVKAYALPPAPKAPALPTDLASELSTYDSSEPVQATEKAAAAAPSAGHHAAEVADGGAEAFLEACEATVHEEHH